MRLAICGLAIVAFCGVVHGQVFISEFMARNAESLADEDGDFPDWIELFNPGAEPVNLAGWALTDDALIPDQWVFPDVVVRPKSFLVLFASGKNRRDPGQPLHTNFMLDGDGEYLGLFRPVGAGWQVESEFAPAFPEQFRDISYGLGQSVDTTEFLEAGDPVRFAIPTDDRFGDDWLDPSFDDSAWAAGRTGIGFETAVPGFAVRNVKASGTVSSLSTSEAVLANPRLQAGVRSETAAVINYVGSSNGGHYGDNAGFPGSTVGANIDDFVVEAMGTITIPQAGAWTFGVNSDDGFSLEVGPFQMSFPSPRGPGDTLQVFRFTTPGDYPLRLVFYERGGGACLELFAARGNFSGWTAAFDLVGDVANGGLEVRSLPVGGGDGGGSGGYRQWIGTDVTETMQSENSSAYIRARLTIPDPVVVRSLALRMRFDDGFAAYLNGVEVARENAPQTLAWNARASAVHSAAEFEEWNLTEHLDLLRAGENVLAIHGLNRTSDDVDFLIVPELVERVVSGLDTRYFSNGTPGQPNEEGFFAFVGDTRFSQDRGYYDQPFPLTIVTDTPDAVIRYTTDGTVPTETNGLVYDGEITIDKTTVLRAAAFKEGFSPSNVDTQTYLFVADIMRQSLDGSPPPGWPSSWGSNTVDYGMDPAIVNSVRYRDRLRGALLSIPSFSMVMDLDDLFDPGTGIYANPRSDGREWERPGSLELLPHEGVDGFQVNAGVRIRGGFSRSPSNPKHAFRFFFRSEYGDPKLVYPLFGDAGTDTFDGIDLRTFQNYSWSFQGDGRGIFVRDQFSRDVQLAMGHPAERGNFYHLYVNGHYWGLFNTAERPEASYGESYFGGAKDDYDVIKVDPDLGYNIEATDGNLDAWMTLWNLARAGLGGNAAYERVQGNNPDGTPNPSYPKLIDVPNLIDYMLIIFYGGNIDAPISRFLGNNSPNNYFALRNRNGPDGFRFFVHDAEHTILNYLLNEDRTGPFPAGDTFGKSNPQWIMQRMWDNAEFRMLFADHVHRHFFNGGVFTPDGARALFTRRTDEIDLAVVAESARWGDSKRSTPFARDTDWVGEINSLLSQWFPSRSGIVLNQLRNKNLYPSVVAPNFRRHGGVVPEGFELTITAPRPTIYFTRDGSDPRLRGGAVSPTAQTYSGPIEILENQTIRSRVRSNGQWSALNEADFVIMRDFTELFITELMYRPAPDSDPETLEPEFIELKNVGQSELDLSGVHFTSGVMFTFENGVKLEPGEFVVLTNDRAAFLRTYPDVPLAGVYTGRLSGAGETVRINHATGDPIFEVTYDDALPWPIAADGQGFSLVPVNPNANPEPNDAANWRASSEIGGSPGADDSSASILPVFVNEVLTHTDPPEQDAIELFNPNDDPIDIGYWFLSDDRLSPSKYRFPPGTILPANGFLVVRESDFNVDPDDPASFALSSTGDEVYLFSANSDGILTGFSHGFSHGAAANGVSFGAHTISTGEVRFPPQARTTLGEPNSSPLIAPVGINEIRYFPAAGDEEFVELLNRSVAAIPLYDPDHPENTWRLSGIGFQFPPGTTMAPRSLLLLVNSDPDGFRERYAVPADVPIFGPYTGSLANNGERLRLERPDAPDPVDGGGFFVPYIAIDEVRYRSTFPWPTEPAGNGPSMERVDPGNFADDPANWRASLGPASPGFRNDGNRPPQVFAGLDIQMEAAGFPVLIQLEGSATDDGLPNPPGALGLEWRKVDGLGSVIFSAPNELSTTASIPGPGTYTLELTGDDGDLVVADQLIVTTEQIPVEVVLVPRGSTWRYLDDGSNQGTAWRQPDFDDDSWDSGPAELGYGDGGEATTVSFGPNAGEKFTTTYFRLAFDRASSGSIGELIVDLRRDDGAVVYLNGTELFRDNMPQGEITFSTTTPQVVGGDEETTFFRHLIGDFNLVNGRNVLAVEIHQNNGGSSDISFDLELTALVLPENGPLLVDAGNDLTVQMPLSGTLTGQVADDGLPNPPGAVAVQWSAVDPARPVWIADPNALMTSVRFAAPGTYLMRLTADDGELSGTDTVEVTVVAESFGDWKERVFSSAQLADTDISGDDSDPDADGMSNRDEFEAGTDPLDADSLLALDQVEPVNDGEGTVRLRFVARAGKGYRLEYRDSLDAVSWAVARRIDPEPIDYQATVMDTVPTSAPERFYRVVVSD